MGFTPTFYAGRPKLSEVTIDSDLDMGGRTIRAGRIDSPYTPETWPTETLDDWGDTAPSTNVMQSVALGYTSGPVTIIDLPVTANREHEITIRQVSGHVIWTAALYRNETKIGELPGVLGAGASYTYPKFPVESGDVIQIRGNAHQAGTGYIDISITNTGRVVGETVLSLNDKWLALGIDMHGLAATVKIQGVEVPYSDYAKYFPLAPTELKIPGGWDASQIRPIVEVYV